ncbi:hypothetical protein BOTBODRAFT_178159 [Botryobasidium botryosum FD-172 SS1]|uniref:Uncharacterized protein n=1 Tax=Botryobasidium botryosum (strain FD-172 SS1) TaxID=930990 RepID=A0A067M4L9_BOTB1|nr:hypothetical protein BOTBODRAFT_178159 [Botryobasidium botryosum FD-172 SS1]
MPYSLSSKNYDHPTPYMAFLFWISLRVRANKKLLSRGVQYMKLGHLAVRKSAPMAWEVDIDFRNVFPLFSLSFAGIYRLATLRGWNRPTDKLSSSAFTPMLQPQNVLFDVSAMTVVYLYLRGVFAKKFEGFDDLLNDNIAELHIREAMKEKPL